ncbi:cohesin domain-containing protein [Paenibacillus sp. V4I5]|uniref:cohesin domain-containing protein n=1 Tax=Paenibacillus sp. V4I5 TaxID=3042306 RepID=UPI0027950944|nr:cohesin domain-containing protein [Paenibacillus sp. V4I5]MDQ0914636.1 chitodextrinase [Paenibacillus sp. V4I5]
MRKRKKNRTFLVYALLILLSANWFADLPLANAEESIRASLSGEDTVQAGQAFSLTYGLKGVSEAVYAQDLTIRYDAEQLIFLGADSMKDHFSIIGLSEAPGHVRIIAASHGADNAIQRDSELLTLRWSSQPLNHAATSVVSVIDTVVSNGDGVEISVSGATHTVQIAVANKWELLSLIARAQAAHDNAVEGGGLGQYPKGAKAILLTAINSAKTVADQADATQQQIQLASTELEEALRVFLASMHTSEPGDLNGDSKFTIGDLAIAAASYGKTSADPDWANMVKADVHADGKIDIADLAIIARAIWSSLPETPNTPEWTAVKRIDVSGVTSSGLTLTWSGAADPVGVTEYKVYQDGNAIGTVTGSVYQYAITGLKQSTMYSFKVEAGIASGLWSTNGPSVTVTTQAGHSPSVLFTGQESVVGGGSFALIYGLRNVTQSVYSQDITILYDAEHMDFIGVDTLGEGMSTRIDSDIRGQVRVMLTNQGAAPVNEDADLLSLNWKAKVLDQPAIATITINEIILTDSKGIETRISGATHQIRISLADKEGDLNSDNKISVGDLAMVAAAYGGTSADPEWAKYARADVNHDRKVDIEDLAMTAKWIFR